MRRNNKHKRLRRFIIRLIVMVIAIYSIYYMSNEIRYMIYPIKYEEIVSKCSEKYNLDPFLLYAMIKVESSFDAKAVSPKDARGLMQIMPTTGEWIAQKLKDEHFDKEDLFEPQKNIMMGAWYINYLNEKFDGDMSLAIMAYNAGPSNVQNWLLDENVSSDGKTLENIPYDETAKYERKIMNSYNMYKKIYEEK